MKPSLPKWLSVKKLILGLCVIFGISISACLSIPSFLKTPGFQAHSLAIVEVSVRDNKESARPLSGVEITLESPIGPGTEILTDSNGYGRFELLPEIHFKSPKKNQDFKENATINLSKNNYKSERLAIPLILDAKPRKYTFYLEENTDNSRIYDCPNIDVQIEDENENLRIMIQQLTSENETLKTRIAELLREKPGVEPGHPPDSRKLDNAYWNDDIFNSKVNGIELFIQSGPEYDDRNQEVTWLIGARSSISGWVSPDNASAPFMKATFKDSDDITHAEAPVTAEGMGYPKSFVVKVPKRIWEHWGEIKQVDIEDGFAVPLFPEF